MSDSGHTRIGRYQLIERIGLGGMAEVFLARNEGVGGFAKDLVIKMILPVYATEDEFIRLFMNEARLAAQLDHPNIVNVFDFGSVDGRHFIAMELIRGMTLARIQELAAAHHCPIPPPIIARIAASVCAALDYAHELVIEQGGNIGIIHRDVSPENIMISAGGAVKILDFGIARATASTTTTSGTLKGKYGYMAPELILGIPVDRGVDIYSVGVVLYESLSGTRPFQQGKLLFRMLEDIVNQPPPPLSKLAPLCPQELLFIVERAMCKARGDRYATALDMRLELESYLASVGPVLDIEVAEYVQSLVQASRLKSADPRQQTGRRDNTERDLLFEEGEVDRALRAASSSDYRIELREVIDEDTMQFQPLVDSAADAPRASSPRRFERRVTYPGLPIPHHYEIAYDDVASDILNELDTAAPTTEPPDRRARRRVRSLIARATEKAAAGSKVEAVIALDLALQEAPDQPIAQQMIAQQSDRIAQVYETYLGGLAGKPTLAVNVTELKLHEIDSRAAFLLSRIDGVLSYSEILDVSSMPRLEALQHLSRLLLHGIVRT